MRYENIDRLSQDGSKLLNGRVGEIQASIEHARERNASGRPSRSLARGLRMTRLALQAALEREERTEKKVEDQPRHEPGKIVEKIGLGSPLGGPIFTIRFQQGQKGMSDGFIVAVEDGVAGAGKFPDQAFFKSIGEAAEACVRARRIFDADVHYAERRAQMMRSLPEKRSYPDDVYLWGRLF